MKKILWLFPVLIISGAFSCNSNPTVEKQDIKKPNIIYILADDLGYGDIGAYGQELIETPNLDKLAASGMTFTQHYSSAPVCAPARYMLMTGQHSGHAWIRGNDEWGSRGNVWNYRAMISDSTLEGQRPVPDSIEFFPSRLKDIGYTTGIFGKWGLGAPHTNSIPNRKGFDEFYGYICQRIAHNYTPLHLYHNESRVYLKNDTIDFNSKLPEGVDTLDSESYKRFNQPDYAPEIMFSALMKFVDSAATKGKPFFAYWADPIPHVALQAPQRWVDYYVKKFGDEAPYLGKKGYFPSRYPRATYAAMISYLDENVGKLIELLKEKGIYDNTIIIFSSDNGPSYAGGANPGYFNSARPFRSGFGRGKGFVYEGGIRVPMIASWPGHIKEGTTSDLPSVQYDIMATLSEISGFTPLANTDGISLAPTLFGQSEKQKQHDFLYWEFPETGGQIAIRMGNWKVVRQNLKSDKKSPTLELYDLATDPLETTNIAEKHPDIVEKAYEIYKREHTQAFQERFVVEWK